MDVNLARHQGAAAISGDTPWPDVKLCYLAVHTNQSSSAYLSRISNDASIFSALSKKPIGTSKSKTPSFVTKGQPCSQVSE